MSSFKKSWLETKKMGGWRKQRRERQRRCIEGGRNKREAQLISVRATTESNGDKLTGCTVRQMKHMLTKTF